MCMDALPPALVEPSIEAIWQQIRFQIMTEEISDEHANRIYEIIYSIDHRYHKRFIRVLYEIFGLSPRDISTEFDQIHLLLMRNYRRYRAELGSPVTDQEQAALLKISVVSCVISFPNFFDVENIIWAIACNDIPRNNLIKLKKILIPHIQPKEISDMMQAYREREDDSYQVIDHFDLYADYSVKRLFEFAIPGNLGERQINQITIENQ